MEFGVVLPQTEIGPDPKTIAVFAKTAEDAGFSSLMAYDHVIGADVSSALELDGPYTHESQFHRSRCSSGTCPRSHRWN